MAEVATALKIQLEIPPPEDSAGGIIVADVNNDGRPDFLVTVPGHLAVYDNGGQKLWIEKTDLVVGGTERRPRAARPSRARAWRPATWTATAGARWSF